MRRFETVRTAQRARACGGGASWSNFVYFVSFPPGVVARPRVGCETFTFGFAAVSLDVGSETCKLHFLAMATAPNPVTDTLQDFEFPQREAAFFYGLFLRGHSADELRRDIEIPAPVLAKWDKETVREPTLRPLLERIVSYRQRVLAIFENLIGRDASSQRLQ